MYINYSIFKVFSATNPIPPSYRAQHFLFNPAYYCARLWASWVTSPTRGIFFGRTWVMPQRISCTAAGLKMPGETQSHTHFKIGLRLSTIWKRVFSCVVLFSFSCLLRWLLTHAAHWNQIKSGNHSADLLWTQVETSSGWLLSALGSCVRYKLFSISTCAS